MQDSVISSVMSKTRDDTTLDNSIFKKAQVIQEITSHRNNKLKYLKGSKTTRKPSNGYKVVGRYPSIDKIGKIKKIGQKNNQKFLSFLETEGSRSGILPQGSSLIT